MSAHPRLAIVPACLLALVGSAAAQPAPFPVQSLDLRSINHHTIPLAISANGQSVFGCDLMNAAEALAWNPTPGVVAVGHALNGWTSSFAFASTADGAAVVGDCDSSVGRRGFVWTTSGATLLSTLNELPTSYSAAFGISRDGAIIVGESDGQAAYWYDPARTIGRLDPVPTFGSYATATSANGDIITGTYDGQGVRWVLGGMEVLPQWFGNFPPSRPLDLSFHGDVVVGYGFLGGYERAFRWTSPTPTAGGVEDLGVLPGATESRAWAVDQGGSVVVGTSGGQAFVWTPSLGMRRVTDILAANGWDTTGLDLIAATDVSDSPWRQASVIVRGTSGSAAAARVNIFQCYANCDGSTVSPILNVNDFVCFLNRFAIGDPGAVCNPTVPPGTINQLMCFMNKFAGGCVMP